MLLHTEEEKKCRFKLGRAKVKLEEFDALLIEKLGGKFSYPHLCQLTEMEKVSWFDLLSPKQFGTTLHEIKLLDLGLEIEGEPFNKSYVSCLWANHWHSSLFEAQRSLSKKGDELSGKRANDIAEYLREIKTKNLSMRLVRDKQGMIIGYSLVISGAPNEILTKSL